MGANITVECDGEPRADWFADQLRKIYSSYPTRTGDVTVRVVGLDTIEVERPSGSIRVLKVSSNGRSWELANAVNASSPGQIATILANL